jgi:hypothetical protein
MLDQGSAVDWDDFPFVLAVARGGSVSGAAEQLGVAGTVGSALRAFAHPAAPRN